MKHFLAMGGYGPFIWSAYAASGIGLILAVVVTLRAYFRVEEQLRRMRGEQEKPGA